MGKTHKQQLELKQELAAASKHVNIGATYRHYKGADKLYEVIDLAFLEATDEICVIYKATYGEMITFIRPLTSWLDRVEWEGATVPRFTKIDP